MTIDNETGKPDSEGGLGKKVVDTIDAVIEDAGELIGTSRGSKIAGGAAVGALAAIVLPFSLVTGAIVGGAYAAWRQSKK